MPPFTGGIFLQLIPYIALYGMVKSFYRRFFGLRKTAISGLMFGEKMRIKKILTYIACFAAFLLLCLTEKKMGLFAFSVPFFIALVYCRLNIPLLCLSYAASSMILNANVQNLLFALTPCAVVLIGSFLHFRLRKKPSYFILSLYTFLSLLPRIFFATEDIYRIVNIVVSFIGAQIFTFISVSFLYPFTVRGPGFPMRQSETVSLCVLLAVAFAGISYLKPFGINLFMLFASALILLGLYIKPAFAGLAAAVAGLGGAIAQFSPAIIAMCVCLAAAAAVFKDVNFYITCLSAFVCYVLFTVIFSMGLDWRVLAPAAAGCLVAALFPKKVLQPLKTEDIDTFATRTALNRDRQELSEKLDGLSKVFFDMQDILRLDLADKKREYNKRMVTESVVKKCCGPCPYKKPCNEEFGGSYIAENLVLHAMENGRVTLLDLPSAFSTGCKRVSALISSANETVMKIKRRQEINASIEEGRELLIDQMSGVGMLLERLSQDMKSRLSYDTHLENRLLSELSAANIAVSEVIVFGVNKKTNRVILTVREKDASNSELSALVSHVMGRKMAVLKRDTNVNGRVSVHFHPAPKFELLYGEKAVCGDGGFCGDNREAVRLDENRLMLILSDGMGMGERAYRTSMNAILMIESFYRAGFDHETVLATVGRLLSLRESEDFNALDISVIDIKKGTVDFIKQGGRESFLVSNGIVEVVECGSLPLGIVTESMPIIEQRKLQTGDVLMLASDGVIDSLGVDAIKEILLETKTVNPQVIADIIIDNAALHASEKGRIDDMSCLVARVVSAA